MARTQHRSVRITDPDWSDFLMACAHEGRSRGSVVRRLIRLYVQNKNVRALAHLQPDTLTKEK